MDFSTESFVRELSMTLTPSHVMELCATCLSCWGSHMVSLHGHARRAIYGWAAWIVAGVLWVPFAASNAHWFMAITQSYFLYTAYVGFRNTRRNQLALGATSPDPLNSLRITKSGVNHDLRTHRQ